MTSEQKASGAMKFLTGNGGGKLSLAELRVCHIRDCRVLQGDPNGFIDHDVCRVVRTALIRANGGRKVYHCPAVQKLTRWKHKIACFKRRLLCPVHDDARCREQRSVVKLPLIGARCADARDKCARA